MVEASLEYLNKKFAFDSPETIKDKNPARFEIIVHYYFFHFYNRVWILEEEFY